MPYCIFFSLASVIGSQSRGAVLAILAVGAFLLVEIQEQSVHSNGIFISSHAGVFIHAAELA